MRETLAFAVVRGRCRLIGIEPEIAVKLLLLGVRDATAVTVDAGTVLHKVLGEGRSDDGTCQGGAVDRDEGFGHAE
ncbi:hypothetical protein B5P43_30330 [Bacillus sp. SRB_336]|nr:hypothetical protein B5P43_30330 [Bacillus sp. SRB_336]